MSELPVLSSVIQFKNMEVVVDHFTASTGRIKLIVHLSDTLDGTPVEYELWTSREFQGEDFPAVFQLVMNHPVGLITLCESPVETRFYLFSLGKIPGLRPQVQVGSYRVDFGLPERKIAIEVDGHEYHKTREQRTYDAQRERELQISGWRVIRFTGSEIYRDVLKCIDEVAKLLDVFEKQATESFGWSIKPVARKP